MSYTTDPNDPRLKRGIDDKPIPQNEVYLVLSEEERAKGFVRPYRDSYVHVGANIRSHWKRVWKMLDPSDEMYPKYVATMVVLEDENGNPIGGPYVTQEELTSWEKGERVGGCGSVTTMGRAISETYARDPKFYGATYCCGCCRHLSVDEFLWYGTNEKVGS